MFDTCVDCKKFRELKPVTGLGQCLVSKQLVKSARWADTCSDFVWDNTLVHQSCKSMDTQ